MLVNAHTHLELSDLDELLPHPTLEFPRWQRILIQHLRGRTPELARSACERGIAELQAAGTTHIGDISSTGMSVEPLVRSGLTGTVWIELIAFDPAFGRARIEQIARQIDALRANAANSTIQLGLSPHATYSVHPRLWELILPRAEREAWPLCIHAAESPAEWELFTRGRGPLRWLEGLMLAGNLPVRWARRYAKLLGAAKPFLKHMGVPYHLSVNKTPIAYLASQGVLERRPLLVHCVQVSDEDIQLIYRSGSHVVHCPRSNQRLQCGRMPLEKFLRADVPVLLGTDSRTSSPSLDVREEAAAAIAMHSASVSGDAILRLTENSRAFTETMS